MSENKKIRKVQGIDDDIRNLLITETKRTGGDPSFLFEILEGIIEQQSWLELKDELGEPVGTLQRLIESPPPVGCGMPISRLRQLLKLEHRHEGKSDDWKQRMGALRRRLNDELGSIGKHGGDKVSSKVRATSDSEVAYHSETTDYKLARLKRYAPDLAKKVSDEEISTDAAYMEAGFKPLRRAVNMEDAQSAYNTLTKFMPDDVLHELIELLTT